MFQQPEEAALVQRLVAQAGHNAVVAVVGRLVVPRVRRAADGDAHVLQRIHPARHLALHLVRPLVKFLRHDLGEAEDREEEGDHWILWSRDMRDGGHRGHPERNAQLPHVVRETSVGDRPRRRVVALESGDDVAHDGGAAVAVVVDGPM